MIISRPLLRYALALIAFAPVVSVVLLNGCHNNPTPPSLASQIAGGKTAAQKYCVSCHEFPDPALIDRKSWVSGVLPAMGKNLGIKQYMGQYYTDAKSSLNISDWQNIITYYTQTSPVNLYIPKPAVAPLKEWSIFSLIRPKNVSRKVPAMTTMITVDTLNHKVYSGDAANNMLEWDARLNSKLIYHFRFPGYRGATYLKTTDNRNTAIVTCIGNLPPVNQATGQSIFLKPGSKKQPNQPNYRSVAKAGCIGSR